MGKNLVDKEALNAQSSVYSESKGDFTSSVAGGNKDVVITGLGFVFTVRDIINNAAYRDTTADNLEYDLPIDKITVAGALGNQTITFNNKLADFAATDIAEIQIMGPERTSAANTSRTVSTKVLPTQQIGADGTVTPTGSLNTNAPFSKITDGTTDAEIIPVIKSVKSDLSSVAGTATDVNSGNASAGSQRVVVATDDVNLAAINTATALANLIMTAKTNPAVKCVGKGSFSAVVTDSAKTVTISGHNFTLSALKILGATYRRSDVLYLVDISEMSVSGDVITFTSNVDFATGDEIDVYILDTEPAFSQSTNTKRITDTSPINLDYEKTSIEDDTNIAHDTYYYDIPMDGFKDLSFTGKLIESDNTETITMTVEFCNDEDLVAGDWIQVAMVNDKTGATITEVKVTGTGTDVTEEFAVSLNNAGAYSNARVKLVITDSNDTNTVVIKAKRKAL